MNKILGIDTGGTYTDAVVICADSKEILHKSKTLTTHHKLRNCIETSFERIPSSLLADISMVCLSTTLATNAIVENHGCKEGLILIGEKPQGRMPTSHFAMIQGKYDIKGRLKENIDPGEVLKVVEFFRDKVDAIAISGYASVRNPTHELYVKKVIEQQLGVPVVCAHELTSSLGFYDRTVTVDLNAKLIPIVCDLMDSVKSVMQGYQIQAPLMIVKGDGRLMTDVCARNKPIETILSGPAASVIGAIHLSGKKEAFVLDMGGTTTDIANVSDGRLNVRSEGAKIGDWFTHVQAAEVFTTGLGGDSRIYQDHSENIKIGPGRAIPFSMAAEIYPELLQEIGEIFISNVYRHFCYQDEEAYQLIKKHEHLSYNDEERIIIEVLRSSPHTLYYLQENIHMKNLRGTLNELLHAGVIGLIALTPTDVLHVTGRYKKWNPIIAEMGVKIAAERCKKTPEAFIAEVERVIIKKLDSSCIQAAMYFDQQVLDMSEGSTADYFLNKLFFHKSSSVLEAAYRLKKDVVAIGAPSGAWASKAGKELFANIMIPEHAEVANAVGAAVGRAVESVEVLIRLDDVTDQYIVFSPMNRTAYDTLNEATAYAREIGQECVKRLSATGICNITYHQEDMEIEDSCNNKKIFVERLVVVSAQFRV